MAKGLIGRHLNDCSPVFNTEGVWQRSRRENPRDYCSWQVDDRISLSHCQQMYACAWLSSLCPGLCALYEPDGYCMCAFACMRLSGCVNPRATWLAGVHMSPAGFLTQCHHEAETVYITQIPVLYDHGSIF